MYQKVQLEKISSEEFELPFEGKLSENNRWIIMASLIPWSEFEDEYAVLFSEDKGAPAKSFRMALGALIIKEKLGASDRETVEQIQENPYLQYFIGLTKYTNEAPFEASMLSHFRLRIGKELVNKINKRMVLGSREISDKEGEENQENDTEEGERKNEGKLIVDATCSPADISYPTDIGLLNQAREHTERILDKLYKQVQGKLKKKPRNYRNQARKDYLNVAKSKKPSTDKIRKGIQNQLQYINRNVGHIQQLIASGAVLDKLNKTEREKYETVLELYRQQFWMWSNNKQSIPQRIVSLSQPHVRPIVRGKAGKSVEFGAKLAASCVDAYIFLDHLSWDNFNESCWLQVQIEKFKEERGYYPESVHADQIYRTRENRRYCKERGIRLSGPPLGRPAANVSQEQKKQALLDERIRNWIEGKFGQAKRRFSLGRVMPKLSHTSETAIAITFLVINLSTLLRQVFLRLFFKITLFLSFL